MNGFYPRSESNYYDLTDEAQDFSVGSSSGRGGFWDHGITFDLEN